MRRREEAERTRRAVTASGAWVHVECIIQCNQDSFPVEIFSEYGRTVSSVCSVHVLRSTVDLLNTQLKCMIDSYSVDSERAQASHFSDHRPHL